MVNKFSCGYDSRIDSDQINDAGDLVEKLNYFESFVDEIKFITDNLALNKERALALSNSQIFIEYVNNFLHSEKKLGNVQKEDTIARIISICNQANPQFKNSVALFLNDLPLVAPFNQSFMSLFTVLLHSNTIIMNSTIVNQILNLISFEDNMKTYGVLLFVISILKYASFIQTYDLMEPFAQNFQAFLDVINNDNMMKTNKINSLDILIQLPLNTEQIHSAELQLKEKYETFSQSLQAKVLKFINNFIPSNFVSLIFNPKTYSMLNSQVISNLKIILSNPSTDITKYFQTDEILSKFNEYCENSNTLNRFNPFIVDLGILLAENNIISPNQIEFPFYSEQILKDRQKMRTTKYASFNNKTRASIPFKLPLIVFSHPKVDRAKLSDTLVRINNNIWISVNDDELEK